MTRRGISLLYVARIESGKLTSQRVEAFGAALALVSATTLAGCLVWAGSAGVLALPNAWSYPEPKGWAWPVFGVWATALGFAALLWAVLSGPARLRQVFSLAPVRFLGGISYSIYIWHEPLIEILHGVPATLAVIFLLSVASYYLIERPFLKRRASQRELG